MTTTIITTSIVSILAFSLIILILANIDEDLGLQVACTIWFPIIYAVMKIIHKVVFTVCKKTLNRYYFYYLNENMNKPHYIQSFLMTPKMAERFRQSTEENILDGYSILLVRKGKDFKSMPYLKEELLTEEKIRTNWNGITFEKFLK